MQTNQSIWNQMYVIHLIILLNILGVMIDNKRFVFYIDLEQQELSFFIEH